MISFRKTFNWRAARMNLSKSGVGVSAGKGLRIGTGSRGNYVAGGSNGLMFVKHLNARRNAVPNSTMATLAGPVVVIIGSLLSAAITIGILWYFAGK